LILKEVLIDLSDRLTPLALDLGSPWLKIVNKSNVRDQ
jgi:hypothetical protein